MNKLSDRCPFGMQCEFTCNCYFTAAPGPATVAGNVKNGRPATAKECLIKAADNIANQRQSATGLAAVVREAIKLIPDTVKVKEFQMTQVFPATTKTQVPISQISIGDWFRITATGPIMRRLDNGSSPNLRYTYSMNVDAGAWHWISPNFEVYPVSLGELGQDRPELIKPAANCTKPDGIHWYPQGDKTTCHNPRHQPALKNPLTVSDLQVGETFTFEPESNVVFIRLVHELNILTDCCRFTRFEPNHPELCTDAYVTSKYTPVFRKSTVESPANPPLRTTLAGLSVGECFSFYAGKSSDIYLKIASRRNDGDDRTRYAFFSNNDSGLDKNSWLTESSDEVYRRKPGQKPIATPLDDSTAYKVRTMLAAARGAKIVCRSRRDPVFKEWGECTNPNWNWGDWDYSVVF